MIGLSDIIGLLCLQMMQEDAGKGVKVLAAVDQSYSSLRILVSPDTAQLLSEKVEGERTRLVPSRHQDNSVK